MCNTDESQCNHTVHIHIHNHILNYLHVYSTHTMQIRVLEQKSTLHVYTDTVVTKTQYHTFATHTQPALQTIRTHYPICFSARLGCHGSLDTGGRYLHSVWREGEGEERKREMKIKNGGRIANGEG